jgi:hypothetical protein
MLADERVVFRREPLDFLLLLVIGRQARGLGTAKVFGRLS